MSSRDNEPIQNLSLAKSNEMISAKYKSTLLESQVMAIALTRIEVNANDMNYPLEAKLYPGELRSLVSDPVHIYRDLAALAKSITGHTMFIEDGKGNFRAMAMVPTAEYQDGVFTIKFNNDLRDHILGMNGDFTTLELSVLTEFTRNSSFRIYEILKKDLYKSKPDVNGGRVDVEYRLSEFRFMIGLANSDDQGVKNEMARMGKNIDWDVLYQKLDKKDRKYEKWYDLAKYVIRPAQEELEKKSNIRFEFEGQRNGHKMDKILFHLYPNEIQNAEVIIEKKKILDENENKQLKMPRDLPDYAGLYDAYVGHNGLTAEDIDLLLNKAEYKRDVVESAIRLADEQAYIRNYMGWLIKCITEGYKVVEVVEGSAGRATVTRELQAQLEEDRAAGVIQKRAWEKIQTRENFLEFVQVVEEKGLSMESLEAIYPLEEIIQMYTDWVVGREIEF